MNKLSFPLHVADERQHFKCFSKVWHAFSVWFTHFHRAEQGLGATGLAYPSCFPIKHRVLMCQVKISKINFWDKPNATPREMNLIISLLGHLP
jgi:hypothetical protein